MDLMVSRDCTCTGKVRTTLSALSGEKVTDLLEHDFTSGELNRRYVGGYHPSSSEKIAFCIWPQRSIRTRAIWSVDPSGQDYLEVLR